LENERARRRTVGIGAGGRAALRWRHPSPVEERAAAAGDDVKRSSAIPRDPTLVVV
jgi:hypothetical protein